MYAHALTHSLTHSRPRAEFEIQELAVEHPDVCSVLQGNIQFDNSTSYAQTHKIELKYAVSE